MIKKQIALGAGLMVAGTVMMAAIFKQPKETPPAVTTEVVPQVQTAVVTTAKPLTVDFATESEVLQEKQKERQAVVEETQAQSSELMAQRQNAEAFALQKATTEAQAEVVANLKVQARPESIELAKQQEAQKLEQQKLDKQKTEQKRIDDQKSRDKVEVQKTKQDKSKADDKKTQETKQQELKTKQKAEPPKAEEQKAKQKTEDKKAEDKKAQEKARQDKEAKTTPKTHTVQAGDSLIRLSKEYNIPVSILAEANNMGRNDALQRGRTIKIPTAREVKDLQYLIQKREEERLAKEQAEQKRQQINDRLAEARRDAKKQGINDGYAVQVALATTQAKADEVATAYKKAGYKVRTVQEARGVRVIVGAERSREAATALKDKINNDPTVKADGAWVIQSK